MLAISILNRNWYNDTIKCVDSLLSSDFWDYEIHILDNWSSDQKEYHNLLEKYSTYDNIYIYHSKSNLWFTWGNNYIIKKILNNSNIKYIMLLNNDCKIDKDFLWKFITSIIGTWENWIFWPVIRSYDWSVQAAWSNINLWTWSSTRFQDTKISDYRTVDYVTWSCMVVSRIVLESIWWLDDRYFAYWEESDFCIRAKTIWYMTYVMNVNWIYHDEDLWDRRKRWYYVYFMFRNRILFLKKHANILQYVCSRFVLIWYIIILFPLLFWFDKYKYLLWWLRDWMVDNYGKAPIL